MRIRTRLCMSADGYVTTPDGRPTQLALPAWDPQAYGFTEFQARCDAVLMGRTTFEPALSADPWPWADVDVFVLGSRRPAGTPGHVVIDSDPARLLEKVRAANRGGDVHLIGGPRTIEAVRRLGALDELGLLVLPLLVGEGMQLTPSVSTGTGLRLTSAHPLPSGAVEIVYACASAGAETPPGVRERLERAREYLSAPRCAVLSTLGTDGAPHPAVVHYMLEEDALIVNGRADRRWVINARGDRRVSVVVHDAAEPLHWVGIKGTAEFLRDDQGAVEDAMTLARRYGEDPEGFRDQQRVSFRIMPRSVTEYRV